MTSNQLHIQTNEIVDYSTELTKKVGKEYNMALNQTLTQINLQCISKVSLKKKQSSISRYND